MTTLIVQSNKPRRTTSVRTSCGWYFTELRREIEIPRVIEPVQHLMWGHEYSAHECFAMQLVLVEALTNAIRHGHQGDARKLVSVRYLVNAQRVVAVVHDQGDGFNPCTVPDPTGDENLDRCSGRGLHLIRHYTTWFRHNPRGN